MVYALPQYSNDNYHFTSVATVTEVSEGSSRTLQHRSELHFFLWLEFLVRCVLRREVELKSYLDSPASRTLFQTVL